MSSSKESIDAPRSLSWTSWLLKPFYTRTPPTTVSQDANQNEAASSPVAVAKSSSKDSAEPSALGDVLPMAGTWQKDEAASDAKSFAEQVAMLHMSSLYSYAALHYMWGLELRVSDEGFTKKYLVKHVPAYIFAEVERYIFGESTTMGRRDRRSGSQKAVAQNGTDSVQCDIEWSEPYAGTVREVYTLSSAEVLRIVSTLTMGDKVVVTTQVFNKT